MQVSLEFSPAIKRRRIPIKIIEPSAASTSFSAVPVPSPSKSPVVELSSQAVRPASSNARTDTLEPESFHSLKLTAMDAFTGNGKVSLATGSNITDDDKKEPPEGNRTSLTPTLPSSANSKSGGSKQNSFKDAKQARESAKPSRVGGGIFRASGSNTIFTPRDNGNPTSAEDPQKSDSSRPSAKDDSNLKTSYMPVPKAPNTLFDFVKSWGSLGSTEEKWQLINVSIFSQNDDSSTKITPHSLLTFYYLFIYRVSLLLVSQHCVKLPSNLPCLYPSWRPSSQHWKTTPELKESFKSIWKTLQGYLGLILYFFS